MMKKNYFSFALIALLFGFGAANAQNMVQNGDLELWTAGVPDNWDHVENITQESIIVYSGTYSAKHQSAASTTDFGHEYITGITEGNAYTLSYYFLDNDANAKTRLWSKFLDASGAVVGATIESSYSVDDPNWVHYSSSLIAPVGATQFYLEVRVYKEAAEGGYVYYDEFSFTGDQTVLPEPTNYPTNFTALASGLSIDLSWSDAVGAQLPRAYLVQGVKAGVVATAPVDGIAIADDLDWTDGIATVNVDFGLEAYAFSNLPGNQEFSFTIYPFTNAGANIDYKTDGTVPTATATTANATIINFENFSSGLGIWTPYNVIGDQEWTQSIYGGITFAKMSGYAGAPFENEDWLVSPVMNLTLYENIQFSFITATNYSGPALQLYYSQDYQSEENPNDYTWTEITDQAMWSEGSFAWAESGNVTLDAYASSAFYLGYRFTSNATESATWEVTDCMVMGILKTGIQQNDVVTLTIYPNPASDMVTVIADQDAKARIVNFMGQTVMVVPVVAGTNQIQVNALTEGMYLIEITYSNGTKAINRLLVN